MYDLIGDIHGHADALMVLLGKLGYEAKGETFVHPEGHMVIFLGDYIDRGPKIRLVLETVRRMIDSGNALAIQGNHEFNAVCFAVPDGNVDYLRKNSDKNRHQHAATLEQLGDSERADWLKWFRSLPMWLDLGGVRAVHACWDDELIAIIQEASKQLGFMSDPFLVAANDKSTDLYRAVDALLKGKEADLPEGVFFLDRSDEPRHSMRTHWYQSPIGRTFGNYALQSEPIACEVELPPNVVAAARPYPPDAPPVFFGHYWMKADTPLHLADNVACLDFSVAKDGYLCAYRWDGEQNLDARKFVTSNG